MGIFVYLILGGLAAFRMAELLIIDNGPFDVFANLRGWVFQVPYRSKFRETLSAMFQCVHCLGFWLCLPLTCIYYLHNFYLDFVLLFFAMAGLQSILAHKVGRVG